MPHDNIFSRFASTVTRWTGSTWAFIAALAIIAAWGLTGPLFHYSDTRPKSAHTAWCKVVLDARGCTFARLGKCSSVLRARGGRSMTASSPMSQKANDGILVNAISGPWDALLRIRHAAPVHHAALKNSLHLHAETPDFGRAQWVP